MKIAELDINWPRTCSLIILTTLLFWGWGCPARVPSLITNGKKVTRPELQIELDTIIATAEFRMAKLDQQDQFRDIIFKNAMLMIEGGTLNPIGIITLLAGLYGVTRGAKDIRDRVKKKTNST